MRNKIAILMVILMIALVSVLALPVNAANATVNLNSETQVNPGDTFIVTVNAAYEEGINGIEGTLSYDKDKLELTNVEIVNTLNWSVLNETVADGLNLAIVCNSTSKITNAEIIKIHFKVKDAASIGTTTKIELKDITIDGDTANSTQELGTKEIQVSIVEETTNPGDNPTDNPGDTPNEPGDDPADNPGNIPNEPTDDPADDPENTPNEPTDDPADNPDNPSNKPTDDSKFEDIKEDNTKTENKMPDTGASSIIGIMAMVAVFGTICLVKYNKYREI